MLSLLTESQLVTPGSMLSFTVSLQGLLMSSQELLTSLLNKSGEIEIQQHHHLLVPASSEQIEIWIPSTLPRGAYTLKVEADVGDEIGAIDIFVESEESVALWNTFLDTAVGFAGSSNEDAFEGMTDDSLEQIAETYVATQLWDIAVETWTYLAERALPVSQSSALAYASSALMACFNSELRRVHARTYYLDRCLSFVSSLSLPSYLREAVRHIVGSHEAQDPVQLAVLLIDVMLALGTSERRLSEGLELDLNESTPPYNALSVYVRRWPRRTSVRVDRFGGTKERLSAGGLSFDMTGIPRDSLESHVASATFQDLEEEVFA